MSYRRDPFAVDEWYHCFTRGIDKRTTFESEDDCHRFIQLLYLANDTKPISRDNFYYRSHKDILLLPKNQPIVSIGGYCLMNTHYHLLLREIVENGISRFMQKVGTGYSMYFNAKNQRIGNVFVKPFRSKHVANDIYLRHVPQYIHLNPAEIYEPGWKKGIVANMSALEKRLIDYPFSSLADYHGTIRPERAILDFASFDLLSSGLPKLSKVLKGAADYYADVDRVLNPRGVASRID
ncbi:MAG TPA: transposase [Candidatus Paceibacterota bacterium]